MRHPLIVPSRRALAYVGVTFAVALGALTTTGAPASAAEQFPSKVAQASGLYDCVSTSTQCSTKVTTADAGVTARMVCWREGRTADNQAKWFYVRLSNGRQGYLPAPRISAQTTVKSCLDTNASVEIDGVIASNWALSRNFQTGIGSTDATTLTNVFAMTPAKTFGDWSGDCISFAALAWYSAGTKIKFGNARAVYDQYLAAGKVSRTQNPPRGALVFWNAYSGTTNYGHVEISLGNNRSIGTTGWDKQWLANAAAAISYGSSYLGWVSAP